MYVRTASATDADENSLTRNPAPTRRRARRRMRNRRTGGGVEACGLSACAFAVCTECDLCDLQWRGSAFGSQFLMCFYKSERSSLIKTLKDSGIPASKLSSPLTIAS